MRAGISFLAGIIICGLVLFGIQTTVPIIRAETGSETDNLTSLSSDLSQSLIDLIPDIENIYHDALTSPFQEAGKKIYDEDLAQFYQQLLEKSELNAPPGGTE